MPVMTGYEAIKVLKNTKEYRDIPVMFLSAMDDAESEIEGLNLGAVDYIHKPFVGALLKKRIETHLAIMDAKKEMLDLRHSIEELQINEIGEDTDSEVIKTLLSETKFLLGMDRKMRDSIITIIDLIETAIKTDEVAKIKHCLSEADIEARLVLEIIDDKLKIKQ
jgi:response regulator RpfG family c-di-GMP phosphodiesterase